MLSPMLRPRLLSVVVVSLVLGTAACSAGTSTPPDPSIEPGTGAGVLLPAANGGPHGVPPADGTAPNVYTTTKISEGMIRSAVNKLDDIAAATMKRSGVPGMAIAVVHGGKVLYAKGFGVRELGKADKVNTDTVFQVASVSKSVSSTCISAAVTDKIVSWSDPVVKYMPEFTLSDPAVTKMVTIGDFFSHRSGVPGLAGNDLEGFGFDREQILAKLNQFPLQQFRTTYDYSNFGMTAGAEAVVRASGKPWDKLCADELFAKTGMTTASYSYDDFLTRPNRTALHFPVGDVGDGKFAPLYTRDADAQAPAGGLSASVKDMAAWMNMVLATGKAGNTQVIDPSVFMEEFTSQAINARTTTPEGRSRTYGYGVNVDIESTGHVRWWHSGAFYVGAGTNYQIIPGADVGIVVLTNAAPLGIAETVATSFTDLVRTSTVERDWLGFFGPGFGALYDNHSVVANPPPASPKPARPLSDYVGIYTNPYVGDVSVTESGGKLTVTLGPKNLSAPLTHYDGDVFSWLAPGGNGDPVSAITFGGPAGQATTMNIELLVVPQLTRR